MIIEEGSKRRLGRYLIKKCIIGLVTELFILLLPRHIYHGGLIHETSSVC